MARYMPFESRTCCATSATVSPRRERSTGTAPTARRKRRNGHLNNVCLVIQDRRMPMAHATACIMKPSQLDVWGEAMKIARSGSGRPPTGVHPMTRQTTLPHVRRMGPTDRPSLAMIDVLVSMRLAEPISGVPVNGAKSV